MAKILAIETSCDETGVAVLDGIEVLASNLASQIDIHKETGGVVPDVAAREHASVISPLITKTLKEAKIRNPKQDVDAVAVTVGPGLIPALVVGTQAARTLAYAWDKPLIPVNHLAGHVYSALLQGEPVFPALALLVSGGHTMLVKMSGHLQYEILGQTRDDAVGEAFDKVARMLELPYPGGPHLSKLAEEGSASVFEFTRPMKNSDDLDFSFSGLKTEVLYKVRDDHEASRADIAASFQQAAVDSLLHKTKKALQQENYQTLLLAGGVAANKLLREQMKELAAEENVELRIAPLELCGDNAIMIGQVAHYMLEKGQTGDWKEVEAEARLPLDK